MFRLLLYTCCIPNFCEVCDPQDEGSVAEDMDVGKRRAGHPYAYPPSPRRRRALSHRVTLLSVSTADEHPVQLQCRQPASLPAFLVVVFLLLCLLSEVEVLFYLKYAPHPGDAALQLFTSSRSAANQ